MTDSLTKLAVLISGNGSNLQAIIDQIEDHRLSAKIVCVISNKADAYGLQRARKHSIPSHVVEHTKFDSRTEFEKEILKMLSQYQPDLIILAGFMRILSPDFIAEFPQRILNIHPSLLPKYKGLNTYQRVLKAGDKEHGATVHIVTNELDSGEIILQRSCNIDPADNAESLQQKVHQIEHVIYPEAIRQYSRQLTQ